MKKIIVLFFIISINFYSKESVKFIFQEKGVLWGFDFVSKNEVLLTFKDGRLYYYNIETQEKRKLSIPKIKQRGQGGLLDVLYYPLKKYVYITFSEKYGDHIVTTLARGIYKNKAVEKFKIIFRSRVLGTSGRHFGSRLLIYNKMVYVTIGDRAKRKYAQDLTNHHGKVLRLTLDGKIPKDSPFKNSEIFSYGHRNPQGIVRDSRGRIFVSEFGPRGGDEINIIEAGKNYGWPIITYGREYYGPKIGATHKKAMEQPITYWVPSISPSGITIYTGDKILKWKENLFIACLSGKHLRRLVLKGKKVIKQEVLFENFKRRIRHVRTGLDGYLYFSTDRGELARIK